MGLRGSNIIHQLFSEDNTTVTAPPARKGRSAELIARRNEKLADRFYFYTVICKRLYEPTIATLSEQFDIAMFTIAEIIPAQTTYIKNLKNQQVTVNDLKKKWPFLTWVDYVS